MKQTKKMIKVHGLPVGVYYRDGGWIFLPHHISPVFFASILVGIGLGLAIAHFVPSKKD